MKILFFSFLCFMFLKPTEIQAQGLQPGECAIMFTYDAAGNLTQREFFCNNTSGVIYRTSPDGKTQKDSTKKINDIKKGTIGEIKTDPEEIIKVNAIMPNPTTGQFMVRLGEPLNNANVSLLDANGKVLEKRRQSGNTLHFDISFQPSGMYFVKIESAGKSFTFKVVKQ